MVARIGTRLGDYLRSHIFMTEDIENPGADLSDLSQFGIEHSGSQTSFFIPTSNGEVGAWYLEPVSEPYLLSLDNYSAPRRPMMSVYRGEKRPCCISME